MDIYKKELNPAVKVFSGLIIASSIMQIFFWGIHKVTKGKLLINGLKMYPMKELYSPGLDGGYFEHYQYNLLFWCFCLSLLLIIKTKAWSAFSIPTIYFFLFIDDSLSFHDFVVGNKIKNFYISQNLQETLPDLIRLKDYAEVSYWIILFLIFLIISIPGLKSKSKKIKKFILTNIILFFILSVFGIGFDLFSSNLPKYINVSNQESIGFFFYRFTYLIEEIGELMVIGFICIWLFFLTTSKITLEGRKIKNPNLDNNKSNL